MRIITGDALEQLRLLPDESVHCCVTSPPYFNLRDYGTAQWDGGNPDCDHSPETRGGRFASPVSEKQKSNTGSGTASRRECACGARRIDRQIGLEPSPTEYIAALVAVFREVRRVLRSDATCWVVIGDSFAGHNLPGWRPGNENKNQGSSNKNGVGYIAGLKPKDLIGIPWSLAFALRDDGWYLRRDIIWSKPSCMPESVRDRCTTSHEYMFMLSKSAKYYYDGDAIAEPAVYSSEVRVATPKNINGLGRQPTREYGHKLDGQRNKRSVWTIASEPFSAAALGLDTEHFAAYPPALIEPCVLAGTSAKGVCAACGAPWIRETEKTPDSREAKPYTHAGAKGTPNGSAVLYKVKYEGGGGSALRSYQRNAVGWSPSCACSAAVVPATILDPFLGAGTTALVADRLGRDCIGIELNADYVRLARHRLEHDAGMFGEIADAAPAVDPGQWVLPL